MKEKFIAWLAFHGDVLERHKMPYFLFIFGIFAACGTSFLYPKIILRMYNFHISNAYIFREIIESNLDIFWHGTWLLPLVVTCGFGLWALDKHQENIRRMYHF